MSLAAAPATAPLTPTAFSQRLLEAARFDGRRPPGERRQLAALLDPFTVGNWDGQAFERALREKQADGAELGEAAREVLALWRLCSKSGAG
jgi:hypothetical protein